jgi:hypothetical protein
MKWLAFLVAGTLPLSVLALPAQGSSSAKLITTSESFWQIQGEERHLIIRVATRFSTSIPAVAATATATGHASSPSGGGDGGLTTPSCDALVKQCVIDDAHAPTGPFSTAFNKYSCVMAFACRARNNQTPDQLLYEMTGGKNPPKSFDLPRFSPSVRPFLLLKGASLMMEFPDLRTTLEQRQDLDAAELHRCVLR